LDKDGSMLEFNYRLGAGFAVVGTVLSRPHTGNLVRFAGITFNPWSPLPMSRSALNSLGLPSEGVDEAVANVAAFRARHSLPVGCPSRAFPIGLSVMGHPLDSGQDKLQGVVDTVAKVLPIADFVEVNESCPNVHHGGGGDDELEARLRSVVAVRDAFKAETGRHVPLLVKLGDLGHPEHTIPFLDALGIDGIVGLNTQKDYASYALDETDKRILDHYTSQHGGGLSGQAIQAKAFSQIKAGSDFIRSNPQIKLRLVHVGGIETAEDVQNSRAAGEAVVLREWYTGLMHALATLPTHIVYEIAR